MHKVVFTEEAKKRISKLDERTKAKIKIACEEIGTDPLIGKPLTRELKGRFSYRVGNYRIIYRVYRDQVMVLILTVGHRKDIYTIMLRKNW